MIAKNNLDEILEKINRKFATSFEPLIVDGRELQILSIDNMPAYLDKLVARGAIANPLRDLPLWAKVWPASFLLGRFLRKFDVAGKTSLELGAGMGVCSLIAARSGFARVIVTDNSADALECARANILKNNLQDVAETASLDIAAAGSDPRFREGVDFIVGSEIFYLDNLHRPLLKFIESRLAPGGRAVFCADVARAKPKFRKMAEKNFVVREVRIGAVSRDEQNKEEKRVYTTLILERP